MTLSLQPTSPLAVVVMAAGRGTRMRSRLAKHLHPLLGRRMLDWVLAAAAELAPARTLVVCSPETEAELALSDARVERVRQPQPKGTGDAVRLCAPALAGFDGDVLVLSGDTPLLTAAALAELVDAHRAGGADATVLSFRPDDPRTYGRIVRDEQGRVRAIVEACDATAAELALGECNSSIYAFRAAALWPALADLSPANAQGELYLTDAVARLVASGLGVGAHVAADAEELAGVNTRVELADAAAVLRRRVLERHMLAGVTIVDPATTWVEADVAIGVDAVIEPFTMLRGRTVVAPEATVSPHSVLDDAYVGPAVTEVAS
jgi:bifunctional UDP-N-acetylglucosamine pyrophosphorylase/glucosamine-1-phosphate N-acetyltransferase